MEGEPRPGKFEMSEHPARDAVLYAMSLEGWAQQSDGDVAASTGFFARISNEAAEMPSIVDAFGDEMIREGLHDEQAMRTLIGHFLLVEDEQGFVRVTQFETEAAVKKLYSMLEKRYVRWDVASEHGDPELGAQLEGEVKQIPGAQHE